VATWLSRIAFHESLRVRRQRRRVHIAPDLDPNTCLATDAGTDIDAPLIRAEMSKTLGEAIDSLPAGLRAIVMLRLVEGLSTRETADSLHLSESNVKVSLHRARRMLSESLLQRAGADFRRAFTFGAARCDRIVAAVFQRLSVPCS
jgi:RNA polymerase sigma-70 factor (ECF subfamily)